jgi:hypothetical protein
MIRSQHAAKTWMLEMHIAFKLNFTFRYALNASTPFHKIIIP